MGEATSLMTLHALTSIDLNTMATVVTTTAMTRTMTTTDVTSITSSHRDSITHLIITLHQVATDITKLHPDSVTVEIESWVTWIQRSSCLTFVLLLYHERLEEFLACLCLFRSYAHAPRA